VSKEVSEFPENKKRMLKELIRLLHSGVPPIEVREKFKHLLEGVSPLEIAKVEEELVQEGMPREEVQRLCDVHLAVFREQLEKQKPEVAPENPINILTEEHKILLQILEKLSAFSNRVQQASDVHKLSEDMSQLKKIADDLLDAEKHYLREENVLFPVLEKHGVKEPPAIMWMEHNQIREKKKQLRKLLDDYASMNVKDFKTQLAETVQFLNNALSSHLFKENNILLPTALQVATEQELKDVKKEFDNIGYCSFTPKHLITAATTAGLGEQKIEAALIREGLLQFETGSAAKEEVEALLRTVPFDLTFVDKDDYVRYFNKSEIFLRTKAVLGRKVQQCHPQKSVHIVNKILDSFKSGKKDVAEFWIPLKGRFIYIRYFAVRDKGGEYLGTMEVTHDVTDLKRLEGEKRLLDWRD